MTPREELTDMLKLPKLAELLGNCLLGSYGVFLNPNTHEMMSISYGGKDYYDVLSLLSKVMTYSEKVTH